MIRRVWQLADGLFVLMFGLSVVVQFNDPDPIRWSAIYGLAAVASLFSALGRIRWQPPAVVGAVALAWAVTIVRTVVGKVPFRAMFSTWEMKDSGIEQSREMYGLILVAAWMLVIALRARRRTSAQ